MGVVSLDIATADINSWLEYKKASERKIEAYKENIDSLIDAICEGQIIVNNNPDGSVNLTHILKFPVGKDIQITKFDYSPRLAVGTVQKHLQGVKSTDADGRLMAYVAALTNQPKSIIALLDTEDYSIAQAIALFFL